MQMETVKRIRKAAWEIEKILGSRRNLYQDGRPEFEVKWRGLMDCIWEPIESFEQGRMEALEEFIHKESLSEEEKIVEQRRIMDYDFFSVKGLMQKERGKGCRKVSWHSLVYVHRLRRLSPSS
jgi:hypothetical protein